MNCSNEVEVPLVDHPRYAEVLRGNNQELVIAALNEILRHAKDGCFSAWVYKNNHSIPEK